MTFHHMIHLASYRAHKAEHRSHNKHDNTGGRELTNQMRSLPEQSVREHTVEVSKASVLSGSALGTYCLQCSRSE